MPRLRHPHASLLIALGASPLLAMAVMGARRPTATVVYPSAQAAIAACQHWQQQEGLFSSGSSGQSTHTRIRGCVVDLDRPLVLGHRYSVVVGAHYTRPLKSLHRKLSQRFPFETQGDHTALNDPGNR